MLTPRSLSKPDNLSGYKYVVHCGGGRGWQASRNGGGRLDGWRGPMRATPLEAAQDYCDYVNNNVTPAGAPALKSAGHTAKRSRNGVGDPEYTAALGYIKDVRAQQEGKQGYVYCIVEEAGVGAGTPNSTAPDAKHPSGYVFGPFCKIGYSTNPEARVAELQTGNPRPLKLLGKIPGTEADEAAMHQRYIAHNVLQEWFVLTPMIRFEFLKAVPSDGAAKVAA